MNQPQINDDTKKAELIIRNGIAFLKNVAEMYGWTLHVKFEKPDNVHPTVSMIRRV